MQCELSKTIKLLRRYKFHKRLPGGRKGVIKTSCAATSTNVTSGRPSSAVHYNLTHIDIKRSCICILWISQMLSVHPALPAERTLLSCEEGRLLHNWEIGGTRESVLNGVKVSHKFGHCDLFSYMTLTKVLYNNQKQFYTFLFFVVPKNSILLKIGRFHMLLQNKVFFRFSYRAHPGTRYFFPSNN